MCCNGLTARTLRAEVVDSNLQVLSTNTSTRSTFVLRFRFPLRAGNQLSTVSTDFEPKGRGHSRVGNERVKGEEYSFSRGQLDLILRRGLVLRDTLSSPSGSFVRSVVLSKAEGEEKKVRLEEKEGNREERGKRRRDANLVLVGLLLVLVNGLKEEGRDGGQWKLEWIRKKIDSRSGCARRESSCKKGR